MANCLPGRVPSRAWAAPALVALAFCWLVLASTDAQPAAQPSPGAADGIPAQAAQGGAAAAAAASGAARAAKQDAGLAALFARLDANRDGQVDAVETARYAGGALDPQQEGWSVAAAAHRSQAALDGADAGGTVSRSELHAHLRVLLQGHRVEEWVAEGLNLPQYTPAFRRNSITALDFPLLVSDGGATLAADLGVASKLHQQQILRGLNRLIWGLGELPSAPQALQCVAANRTTVRLSWRKPAAAGHPALHKFVLQRQRVDSTSSSSSKGGAAGRCSAASLGGAGGSCQAEPWEPAGDPDDKDGTWWDAPPAPGTYRYRLTAWSAFGRSPWVYSAGACTTKAVERRRRAAAALPAPAAQAGGAAVAAAGGNLSAAQAAADGAAWSWSAASSAVVVALTILLKASQLRLGSHVAALWRALAAALGGTRPREQQAAAAAGGGAATAAAAAAAAGAGGLPRVGSSRASLASLGGEAAAEPLAPPAGGAGSLLHSLSSSQLAAGGDSCLWGSGLAMESSGLEAAAAGQPLDGAAAEQLAHAIQLGHHCAHPGCHRRFDRLRDMRRKLESHYCGLCQHSYCLAHTRVSPHGPRGGCGLESRCICWNCFAELAPAQQAACDRANRLPRPAAGPTTGPSAASLASGAFEQAAAQAVAEAQHLNGAAVPVPAAGSTPELAPGAAEAAAGPPAAAPLGEAASAAARRRWRLGGNTLKALLRFKAHGEAAR